MNGDRSDSPLGKAAFDALADDYASWASRKAHNAYYERPATLSLLPDVAGLRVLDVGCGPGQYAEWLVDRGASVMCVDVSERMVELTRELLGDRVEVVCEDVGRTLGFAGESEFDLVLAPLMMDYVEDWRVLFGRFNRALRPDGSLVFSVEHPCSDFSQRLMTSYFTKEIIECTWCGFGTPVPVRAYRRSLSEILNPLVAAGFALEVFLEPQPVKEFRESDPEDYVKLLKWPGFLCIRARKTKALAE